MKPRSRLTIWHQSTVCSRCSVRPANRAVARLLQREPETTKTEKQITSKVAMSTGKTLYKGKCDADLHSDPGFTLRTYVHLLEDDLPQPDFGSLGGNNGATQPTETDRNDEVDAVAVPAV